jgi:hypothetical protein
MISKFLTNPFAKIEVGYVKFYKFVKAHLESLKAANDGNGFDAIIAKLTALITPYEKWLSTQDQHTIDRAGDTDVVNKILDDFELLVDSLWKEVNFVFENDATIKHAIFPNGKSEYNNVTLLEAPVLLQRVADFCNTHKASLKAGRDIASKQLLDSFNAERSEQLGSKSDVSTGSTEGKSLRAAITTYLYESLLRQILIHIDNPAAVEKYYDFSIVRVRGSKKDSSNTPTES